MITIGNVNLGKETEEIVLQVIRENDIGQSVYIEKFEELLCKYFNSTFAIAVSSGSMADIVLLSAIKEIYKCKQVIIPALTFVAQPNAAVISGLDVIFCDVGTDMLMNYSEIKNLLINDGNAIIFTTNLMGRVSDNGLNDSGFITIADSCEAFGSDNVINSNLASTFSFFPSHTLTTGEGGAIITNDHKIAEICRSVRNHGRAKEFTSSAPYNKFCFDYFGYNGKMSGITAAIGIAQMTTIHDRVNRRKQIYKTFCDELKEKFYQGVCPHGMPLSFDLEYLRDRAMCNFTSAGIECRKLFSCLPVSVKYYIDRRKHWECFPVANSISSTTLYLPCHSGLKDEEIEHIIYTTKQLTGRY
jgi:dTDP-4-amino-4,6-dideoxygalactose transaminase